MLKGESFSVYFAGELFSWKHLIGNAVLAHSIAKASEGRYQCVLPQSLEQRDTSPQAIRNQDLLAVLRCDLALFNFDGTELDSGTVVEFMFAKFLDIPSVIVRSDFRKGGDGNVDPWNLMASYYPRTEVILVDSMGDFQSELKKVVIEKNPKRESLLKHSVEASHAGIEELAHEIVFKFDVVIAEPCVMPIEIREHIFTWARLFPGGKFPDTLSFDELQNLMSMKQQKGLLS